jgi:hypothetical protein
VDTTVKIMIVDGEDIIDRSKCMVEGHGKFVYYPVTISEQSMSSKGLSRH